MPKDNSADLMQALIAKLYNTITGNDGNIKIPRSKFVSWLLPGMPFDPVDFKYCSKGLIGDTAEDTRDLQHNAFTLSKLCDLIPDVNNDYVDDTMQQTIFASTQDSISSVYRDVLKYSKVINDELSEKEKAKLQKFRDLLTVTKEVTDILTDEKKTVTEPGPVTLAYSAKMNEYIEAADEYMNLLIDAQSAKGDDPEAVRRVAAWSNKSKFMRKRMEAAEMAWISQGYKNEYEQINAYINQVTQKSMVLYKQDLLNKFNNGLMTSTADGTAGDFYYTTLLPGNFASSPGWTRFTYYGQDFESHYGKKTSQWSAKAGFLGIFSASGSGSGSKTEVNTSSKSTNFQAEMEFTQVQICRPWFDPGFFFMKAWTLDDLWNLNFSEQVSDGGEKPVGRLVAYPVTALFVRNVSFKFDEADRQSKYFNEQIKGGASVGWGPFRIGGSHSRSNTTMDSYFHSEGGAINIPGIQLIGFINNIIPKCPDTNPDIKPEQFVGGE